jgi:hypothetical protein
MTRRLHDVFGDMVSREPPLGLRVDELVSRGERRRTRRRWFVGSAAVAVLLVPLVVVGIVASLASGAPRDFGQPVGAVPSGAASASPIPSPVGTAHPTLPPDHGASATRRAATPSATGAENQLADPGFEAHPLNWDKFGPAALAPSSVVHGGTQALRITSTSTDPQLVVGATSRPVLVRTVAGATYHASCWFRASGTLDALVQVQEYTVDWQRAGDPLNARLTLTDPGRWYQVSLTYTAAQTGNQLPLAVLGSHLTAGGGLALLVDDCVLTQQ